MAITHNDDNFDEPVPADPAFNESEAREVLRVNAIRLFELSKTNGTTERIAAHWYDWIPNGALVFITLNKAGKRRIHRSFNAHTWDEVKEVQMAEGNVAGSMRVN
jgi:YD repeat-containing protein